MNISQLGYDIEHDSIVFKNSQLQSGDMLEVLIPSPINGELVWVQAQLKFEMVPQRWRLVSNEADYDLILKTCNPVGLFARK